jgi:hypothetical protein
MKSLKLSILFVAAALMIMGVAGTSYAFHEGGVAYCEGCHTMHESINGAVIQLTNGTKTSLITPAGAAVGQGTASTYLLKGSDQSSTCFNCHRVADATPSSYHIMSTAAGGANFNATTGIPTERTPGGDFAWLTINGSGSTTAGKHKGHNVVSSDFGLTSSTNYGASSPGGNYPTATLSCISCHDPHPAGRQKGGVVSYRTTGVSGEPIEGAGSYNNSSTTETVGVYRFLAGNGYNPASAVTAGFSGFSTDPPFAVVNSSYNRTEAANDTRVAYGSGMSEWCLNCHGALSNNQGAGTGTKHTHPAGNNALMSQGEGAIYDAYVKTGDMSGTGAAAYTSLVPFEMGLARNAANFEKLQSYAVIDGSKKGGVADAVAQGGAPNVMCLSCHRAHASAFPYALRFGATGGEFVTGADGAYAGYDSTDAEGSNSRINYGYNQAQMAAAYYDRPAATNFAPTQRVLCNKCHAKD